MTTMMAGLIFMFGCTLVSRIMREKSLQLLTAEQKVQLVDSFSRSRVRNLAGLFGVVIIYFLASRLEMSVQITYLIALVIPMVGLLVWSHIASVTKLRALSIPDAYIRTFHRAQLLTYVGLATFVTLFLVDFARR